jgi:hypothetical protein
MVAPTSRSALVAAVARRPDLWMTALRQLVILAPTGWWRRWPPLPTPDRDYLQFRLQTAYGIGARAVPPSDVVGYLEWCRRLRAFGG